MTFIKVNPKFIEVILIKFIINAIFARIRLCLKLSTFHFSVQQLFDNGLVTQTCFEKSSIFEKLSSPFLQSPSPSLFVSIDSVSSLNPLSVSRSFASLQFDSFSRLFSHSWFLCEMLFVFSVSSIEFDFSLLFLALAT